MSQRTKLIALAAILFLLFKNPDGGSSPVAEPGFRVLVVFEKDDLRTKYTTDQRDVIAFADPTIDNYTRSKCVKVNDAIERRSWDDDQDVSKDTPVMQEMRKRADATNLPWLVVSNGRTGYSGPLPTTLTETMRILKEHGGE